MSLAFPALLQLLLDAVAVLPRGKLNDYHRRSLAETAVYRFKILCGPKLASRKFASQLNELHLKCSMLNQMKVPASL